MKTLVIAACIALAGCGGSSKPANSPSTSDVARAAARAVVETAETVWMQEAQACVDTGNAAVITTCDKVLTPTRDLLIEAGHMVDTWTAADQGNLPCLFADIRNTVIDVKAILGPLATTQVYNDLLVLLNAVNTTCTVDGGAQQSKVL